MKWLISQSFILKPLINAIHFIVILLIRICIGDRKYIEKAWIGIKNENILMIFHLVCAISGTVIRECCKQTSSLRLKDSNITQILIINMV